MEPKAEGTLLQSFSSLYYTCKLFGVYPHDFHTFKYEKSLRRSLLGSVVVATNMCLTITSFILLVALNDNNMFLAEKDNLSLVIGFVLTFIGLFAMATDFVTILRSQDTLGHIFNHIDSIDRALQSEHNVVIDDGSVKQLVLAMVLLTVFFEVCVMFVALFINISSPGWSDLPWILTCLPTLYSSLDKIWLVGLILSLRQRFEAINLALEHVVAQHEQLIFAQNQKKKMQKKEEVFRRKFNEKINWGNLSNKVRPEIYFGDLIDTPPLTTDYNYGYDSMPVKSELTDVNKITEKFVDFCQSHDGFCLIGKSINEVWSFSLLMLMEFGFVITAGSLYFSYCASQDQPIPALFKTAQSFSATCIFIIYISGRCVIPMFVSWKTSLAAKRTGVCLHKCAVAADTNEIYEIVNHLSLRLLNHAVDFSAFGYFPLDMKTLYGFVGGIASYLIILIQFNMAGRQVQTIHTLTNSMNMTQALVLNDDNITSFNEFFINWSLMAY